MELWEFIPPIIEIGFLLILFRENAWTEMEFYHERKEQKIKQKDSPEIRNSNLKVGNNAKFSRSSSKMKNPYASHKSTERTRTNKLPATETLSSKIEIREKSRNMRVHSVKKHRFHNCHFPALFPIPTVNFCRQFQAFFFQMDVESRSVLCWLKEYWARISHPFSAKYCLSMAEIKSAILWRKWVFTWGSKWKM